MAAFPWVIHRISHYESVLRESRSGLPSFLSPFSLILFFPLYSFSSFSFLLKQVIRHFSMSTFFTIWSVFSSPSLQSLSLSSSSLSLFVYFPILLFLSSLSPSLLSHTLSSLSPLSFLQKHIFGNVDNHVSWIKASILDLLTVSLSLVATPLFFSCEVFFCREIRVGHEWEWLRSESGWGVRVDEEWGMSGWGVRVIFYARILITLGYFRYPEGYT